MTDGYSLTLSGRARRALTDTLPQAVAAAVWEFATGPLLADPRRVGKPLAPPLAPALSARRGPYRVLYLIDEKARTVTVTATSHRADAYHG